MVPGDKEKHYSKPRDSKGKWPIGTKRMVVEKTGEFGPHYKVSRYEKVPGFFGPKWDLLTSSTRYGYPDTARYTHPQYAKPAPTAPPPARPVAPTTSLPPLAPPRGRLEERRPPALNPAKLQHYTPGFPDARPPSPARAPSVAPKMPPKSILKKPMGG